MRKKSKTNSSDKKAVFLYLSKEANDYVSLLSADNNKSKSKTIEALILSHRDGRKTMTSTNSKESPLLVVRAWKWYLDQKAEKNVSL